MTTIATAFNTLPLSAAMLAGCSLMPVYERPAAPGSEAALAYPVML